MKEQEEKEFKTLFSKLEADQPSMRFTKNVMDSIEDVNVAPVSKRYVNPWIVKSIAIVLIAAVLTLSIYVYNTANTLPKYKINLEGDYTFYIVAVNLMLVLLFLERLISSRIRMKQLKRMN